MPKSLLGCQQPVRYPDYTVLVSNYLYRFHRADEANWDCILVDRELSPDHDRAINEAILILINRRRAAANNNQRDAA